MRFQVVRGAAQGHGACGTPQLGKRHAPDIRTKTHQVNEVCVQRRNHEAGTGDRNNEVDIFRLEAGAFQAFLGGLATQLHRVFDVFVVGFRKRARLDGVVEGENGVPLVHLGIIHDAHHGFETPLGDVKDAAHVVLHVLARDGVRRERRGGGGNGRMHCVNVYSGNVTHGFDLLLLERKGSWCLPLLNRLDATVSETTAPDVLTLPHSARATQ